MTATPSIRDRIKSVQTLFLTRAVTPSAVRENLIMLTALFGNVLDEARLADHDFNLIVAAFVEAGDAVSKAEVRAKVTAQYGRAREAKDTERLTLEMIRGCKNYLQSLDTEMSLAR